MGISVAHAPRPARDPRRSGGGNQPSAIAEPNAAGHWPAFGPPASPPCLPDRTGMALQYRWGRAFAAGHPSPRVPRTMGAPPVGSRGAATGRPHAL